MVKGLVYKTCNNKCKKLNLYSENIYNINSNTLIYFTCVSKIKQEFKFLAQFDPPCQISC